MSEILVISSEKKGVGDRSSLLSLAIRKQVQKQFNISIPIITYGSQVYNML